MAHHWRDCSHPVSRNRSGLYALYHCVASFYLVQLQVFGQNGTNDSLGVTFHSLFLKQKQQTYLKH